MSYAERWLWPFAVSLIVPSHTVHDGWLDLGSRLTPGERSPFFPLILGQDDAGPLGTTGTVGTMQGTTPCVLDAPRDHISWRYSSEICLHKVTCKIFHCLRDTCTLILAIYMFSIQFLKLHEIIGMTKPYHQIPVVKWEYFSEKIYFVFPNHSYMLIGISLIVLLNSEI